MICQYNAKDHSVVESKTCEPRPSKIVPPKVVGRPVLDTKISLKNAQALVAYMTFNRVKAVSLEAVQQSSASLSGWTHFYATHVKPHETWVIDETERYKTPPVSPSGMCKHKD